MIFVITGGSGLIGKAIVLDLQSQGHTIINFDIAVKDNIEEGTIQCDVTSEESLIRAFDKVFNHYGKLDGIINNAYPRTSDWGTSFLEMKMDSWKKNVDLQMNSYVAASQIYIKKLLENNQKGSIVNITSIYGVVGNDFSLYENTGINTAAAYSAIKGGIINFTRYLASEYGKKSIRVNCVSPGGVFDQQDPIFVERYNAKVPMGRMANPEDIAPSVSFLLSEGARYITGQNLIVDGGWTAI